MKAIKRLMKEANTLSEDGDPPPYISAAPIDEDNPFVWRALLSGAHGAEPLRARSLAAASLAHAMGRAAAEARRAGAASRARGAALLSRFRAWEARGFEPPPPPPPPPRPRLPVRRAVAVGVVVGIPPPVWH